MTSPPNKTVICSQSENGIPPPQGRVPRQLSITSASRFPGPPLRQPTSPQAASARYVKQFQALMDHQRQVFDEERALWHTERSDLHEKIAQLEASLSRYQAVSPSQVSSPFEKTGTGSNSSFWSLLSTDGSRQTSASTTGDEFWRGPKTDHRPSRTFSDTSNQSAKPGDRLPRIAEDTTTADRRDQSTSSTQQSTVHKPSVHGEQIDKNLDGINFKLSGLAPAIIKDVMTPQSPSPQQSPSPLHISPGTIPLPSPKLEAPDDPYTKHAGHTPLARHTVNLDGPTSAGASEVDTPTQPELERPPLEPRASVVKVPSERADSYFPVAEESLKDKDPELSEPLSLTNSKSEDKSFLHELDSKLLKAAHSRIDELSAEANESDKENDVDGKRRDFEQPEHEPKLRIKRSMNFGSQLGAKNYGRGF